MLILKDKISVTIASNAGVGTSIKMSGHLLLRIFVKPTTSTNVWTLVITDEDGDQIFKKEAEEGEQDWEVNIPVRSALTLTFSSVDTDEVIDVILGAQED